MLGGERVKGRSGKRMEEKDVHVFPQTWKCFSGNTYMFFENGSDGPAKRREVLKKEDDPGNRNHPLDSYYIRVELFGNNFERNFD